MVLSSELLATAAVSFLLGWTLKTNQFIHLLKKTSFKSLKIPTEDLKLVVVVRTDLKMNRGKIASQCSHATLACYKQGLIVCPDIIKQWESLGQTKVILKTDSGEDELKMLAKKAASAGLVAALIRDAGRTQVPSSTPTVLGIGPDCSSKIDKITSDFRLL